MTALPHRIRRLSFRVVATSQEEALALRRELHDRMEEALLPALSRAFDDTATADEGAIVHVPRLALSVRISGTGDVAAVLAERIEEEARRHLAAAHAKEYIQSSSLAKAAGTRAEVDGLASREQAAPPRVGAGAAPSAARERPLPGMAPREAVLHGAGGPSRGSLPGVQGEGRATPGGFADGPPEGPAERHASRPSGESVARAGSESETGAGTPGGMGTDARTGAPMRGAGPGGEPEPRAGAAPPGTAAPSRALVAMWVDYLETGSLPWPLAGLDAALVLSELSAAAAADPAAVLPLLPAGPAPLRARAALWFRWLQLAPAERWPVIARAAAAATSPGGAALAEIVGALAGAIALSKYSRIQLAAVAIAAVRQSALLQAAPFQTGFLQSAPAAEAAELAEVVLQALGGVAGGGAPARTRAAEVPGGSAAPRASESPAGAAGPRAGEALFQTAAAAAGRLPEPAAAAFRAWLGTRDERADTAASGAPESAPAARTDLHGGRVAASPAGTPPLDTPSRPVSPPAIVPAPHPSPAAPRPPALASVPAAQLGLPPPRATSHSPHSSTFGRRVHLVGLVLLHPFLPRFFESTRVKAAGTPEIFAAELPRAAALLHRLATGNDEPHEMELDFAKVLLGLPIDSPLPVAGGLLSEADLEEVDALLAAAIGHWRALKSTRVAGLRGTFLRRGGLLREEDQGHHLQVEPAPFDMLLGMLPWGIGTIKLPWMKRPLFSDWPAP